MPTECRADGLARAPVENHGPIMTILAIVLGLLASGGTASDEAGDDVRAAVDRWIEHLEASTLAERHRAERELLDLGPKVLPWLPAKELLPGPASRDAVRRIRRQLEKKLAHDSAQASRITLAGEFSLEELIAEVRRQTGNPIRLASELPDSAKHARAWEIQDATFWEALDHITNRLDLEFRTSPESNELTLARREPDEGSRPVSHIGVLRVELIETAAHAIEGDPRHKLIRVQAELDFEPRLRPLFVHFHAGDFSATGPKGESFPAWNPAARYELPMAGAARRATVRWDFVAPADAVPKTISLQGKLLVQLAAATEPIRFDQLTMRKEVLRRRGGVSVRLQETRFETDEAGRRSATVRITVSYDTAGPAFESHRTWVYHNAAWLEDAQRSYPFSDFETLLQADGSVQLEYQFQDLPAAETLRFVYEAPTLLLDVPFELDFRAIAVE
jgi:hypothetical protein